MRIRWTRAATKHRISRTRIKYVIGHCGYVYKQPAPAGRPSGPPNASSISVMCWRYCDRGDGCGTRGRRSLSDSRDAAAEEASTSVSAGEEVAKVTRKTEKYRLATGELLTPELIEELAAEAEAGYDLRNAKGVRVGRPSLERGSSPRVSFRLPASSFEEARRVADEESITLSDLARSALQIYLEKASRRSTAAKRRGRARTPDSEVTAAPPDDRGRRRTQAASKGTRSNSGRTSTDTGRRKKTGL